MITLDFETRSTADLIKWGQRRYAMDASTQALCMCWAYDQEEEVHLWHRSHREPDADEPWCQKSARPDELIERIRDGEPIEAHNAGFEFNIWNEALRREFPEFDVEIVPEQLHCSAAKASCLSLPRALGDAAAAVGLTERKLADGRRLINKLSKPMPLRRSKVAGADTLKSAFEKTILAEWAPGKLITNEHIYRVVDALIPFYPKTSEPHASARNSINDRLRKKGYIEWVSTGLWCYTDLQPPEDPVLMALMVDSEDDEPRWCEEEVEHRKNWDYCAQDVRTERALSNFCPEMSEREREYWLMDFRMNLRGITLDREAANLGLKIAAKETDRLNGELAEITKGQVIKGSQRGVLLNWANGRLIELGHPELPDTRADTLSFALDGVPTKAGDEAREAAREPSRAKWEAMGEEGAKVERVLRVCMEVNRSSVAKYRSMVNSVCPDNRLHDIMLYNGADRTGRWSGKGVQPHNFVRGYKKEMDRVWEALHIDPAIITMVWGDEPMVALAKACRGALVAGKGNELYAADFNAIEARKLAWLSGCASLLNLFNTPGGDPYIDMAEAIYGRKLNKKENPNERNLGKKAILGLGYAMGWEKFQATVWNDEGIWLDDEFCQMVVNIYRKKKYPEVPLLWKSAEKAAIAAVLEGGWHACGGDAEGHGTVYYFMSDDGNFLHCQLPSGRLLAYLYPRVSQRVTYRFNALNERGTHTTVSFPAKKKVPQHQVRWHAEKLAEKQRKRLLDDPPESFVSPHLSFMGRDTYTKQWRRCGTHGGTLVENFDQASSRDLLAEAMYRVDQHLYYPFELLLSIHDEVIAEAPIGTCKLEEFEAIMAEVPKWAPGMPIAAEGWIGPRLRK